jgi:SAM-dependent methyltransferase
MVVLGVIDQPGRNQLNLHNGQAGEGTLDMTSGLFGMQYELREVAAVNVDMSEYRKVTVRGNFQGLPFRDNVFEKVLYDPPHTVDSRNTLLGTFPYYPGGEPHLASFKYGCYRNVTQLREAVANGTREAYRVLKSGGVMIFKWSDSEKPFSWADDTIRKAAPKFDKFNMKLHNSRAHSGNLTIYIWYRKKP